MTHFNRSKAMPGAILFAAARLTALISLGFSLAVILPSARSLSGDRLFTASNDLSQTIALKAPPTQRRR